MINYSFIRPGFRAAAWSRVSSIEQEKDGGSLQSQQEICDRFAQERGYEIIRRFGGKHESAKTPGKMVQEMVKFVKKNSRLPRCSKT